MISGKMPSTLLWPARAPWPPRFSPGARADAIFHHGNGAHMNLISATAKLNWTLLNMTGKISNEDVMRFSFLLSQSQRREEGSPQGTGSPGSGN